MLVVDTIIFEGVSGSKKKYGGCLLCLKCRSGIEILSKIMILILNRILILTKTLRNSPNSVGRGSYLTLGHPLPEAISFFFKWEENKYLSPYVYCFIFKSDLLNSNFVEKYSYFIRFFLESYFCDEQSKFLDVRFYWNKKVKHRFIYKRKLQ